MVNHLSLADLRYRVKIQFFDPRRPQYKGGRPNIMNGRTTGPNQNEKIKIDPIMIIPTKILDAEQHISIHFSEQK